VTPTDRVEIRRVGVEQAEEVLRIMRGAFEEYRGKLAPPSGALSETIEDVRNAIDGGGRFPCVRRGPSRRKRALFASSPTMPTRRGLRCCLNTEGRESPSR
jgi:hypothetical protein